MLVRSNPMTQRQSLAVFQLLVTGTALSFVPLEDGQVRWHANETRQSDPGLPLPQQLALHQDANAFRTLLLLACGGLLSFTSN